MDDDVFLRGHPPVSRFLHHLPACHLHGRQRLWVSSNVTRSDDHRRKRERDRRCRWRRAGVNHVLVFRVNPRDNLNYQSLMTVGMGLLVLWAVSAIGTVYSVEHTRTHDIYISPFRVYLCAAVRHIANSVSGSFGYSRLYLHVHSNVPTEMHYGIKQSTVADPPLPSVPIFISQIYGIRIAGAADV